MRGLGSVAIAAVLGAVASHVLERPIKGLTERYWPKPAPKPAAEPARTKEG